MLIKTNFEAGRVKAFIQLPDNIAKQENIDEIAKLLQDKKQRDIIVTDWIIFFRDKYRRIAD
jgi:hypothetical protein